MGKRYFVYYEVFDKLNQRIAEFSVEITLKEGAEFSSLQASAELLEEFKERTPSHAAYAEKLLIKSVGLL